MVTTLLSAIFNLGIDKSTSVIEKRQIRILNSISIFFVIISLFFAVDGIRINYWVVVMSLSITLVATFALVLSYLKKHLAARLLIIVGGMFICTNIPVLVGERDGAEHGHFIIITLIFIFFNNPKIIYPLTLLSLCGFAITKWSFINIKPIFQTEVASEQFLWSVAAIFVLNILALRVFKSEYLIAEKATQNAYEEMKMLSEEINTQNEELRQQQEELVTQRDYLARQAKSLEEKTIKLLQGQTEMELANKEVQIMLAKVQEQKKEVETRTYDITQSIVYAERIQNAILPQKEDLSLLLPQNFVFARARNIVSGDFYWINGKMHDNIVVAVADCTGHGVPAAMLSMLGANLLNQIVIEHKIYDPATILNELDRLIRHQLRQETYAIGEIQDGMEMALCKIDKSQKMLYYATARRSIFLMRNKEIITLKGNREPIGGSFYQKKNFQTFEIQLQEKDIIYMVTDGFTDQYNNHNNEKYSIMRFKEFLIRINGTNLAYQEEIISTIFDEWKGYTEQTDDVLVVAFEPLA